MTNKEIELVQTLLAGVELVSKGLWELNKKVNEIATQLQEKTAKAKEIAVELT